ncbi:hypothetical protein Tco_0682663 [Tanacetum coccineum]|uniref:Uncharacterized protein n=1 Tax=Tanacetum coccineum TaxID=301880 RepID=A0ABQ4XRS7_9ASTR
MLAPDRSAKAKHSSIPEIHKNHELAGSPSFPGNLFQDDRRNNSRDAKLALKQDKRKANLETHFYEDFKEFVGFVHYNDYSSFHYHALEDMEEKLKVLVFGTGATIGATMGSKTGVVIELEKEQKLGSSCSKSNAPEIS